MFVIVSIEGGLCFFRGFTYSVGLGYSIPKWTNLLENARKFHHRIEAIDFLHKNDVGLHPAVHTVKEAEVMEVMEK